MGHSIPRAEKLIGKRIDKGRLCLIEPLGHGSGGTVFRAIDTRSSKTSCQQYAVKCMFRAKEGTRLFEFQRREIHVHSTLAGHPNIVTLHKVLVEKPYIFLVMDYCPGGDMFKYLTERRTYCRNDMLVKSVFVQLIDAVQACHDSGVYHRDIKPENIMCNDDGSQVWLADFGLSTNCKWSSNFRAGTAGYMSPECIGYQNGPKAYSPQSNDVWALGIIFTSMISGHNPWKRAVMSDNCFRAFIQDSNFLRSMLPISETANSILQRIFVSSKCRIPLTKLRQMVLDADTFFMSDEEISRASIYVQCAAASYFGTHSSSIMDSASSRDVVINAPNVTCRRANVEAKGAELEKRSQSLPVTRPQAHVVRLHLRAHSHPTSLAHVVVSGIESDALPHYNKLGAPPPQPMPSSKDLIAKPTSKSRRIKMRLWRSEASTFLKRIMDKIFVE